MAGAFLLLAETMQIFDHSFVSRHVFNDVNNLLSQRDGRVFAARIQNRQLTDHFPCGVHEHDA